MPLHVHVLVLLFTLNSLVVLGDWDDGRLSPDDVYGSSSVFSKQAYSVYRLPYGLTFAGITFNATGLIAGQTLSIVDHVPCPQAQNCDASAEEELLTVLTMSDLAVVSTTPFNLSSLGRIRPQRDFPLRDVGGNVTVLTSSKLVRFSRTLGGAVAVYPADPQQLTAIANGAVDPNGTYAYLLDLGSLSVQQVSLASMQLAATIDLTPFFQRGGPVWLSVDTHLPLLHVVGPASPGLKLSSYWAIVHFFTANNTAAQPVVDYFEGRLMPAEAIDCFFGDTRGRLYFATHPVNNTDRFDYTLYRIVFPSPVFDSSNFTLEAATTSLSNATTGRFFAPVLGQLFLTTAGGELVRFGLRSPLSHGGTMTCTIDQHDKHSYSEEHMPILGPAAVAPAAVVAYVSTWNIGMMIRVNLQEFCDDGKTCVGDEVEGIRGWQIALIVVACALGVSGIAGLASFLYRRHQKRKEAVVRPVVGFIQEEEAGLLRHAADDVVTSDQISRDRDENNYNQIPD